MIIIIVISVKVLYNVNSSIPKTLVKYLIEWYARFNCKDDALMEILLDIIDTPISPELLPSDGKKVVQKIKNGRVRLRKR